MHRFTNGTRDLLKISFVVFGLLVVYHVAFHLNLEPSFFSNNHDTSVFAVIEEEQRVKISLQKNANKAAVKAKHNVTSLKRLNQVANKKTMTPTSATPASTTVDKTTLRDRLGVILYIPNSESHVRQFLAFAYASWKHITDKEDNLFQRGKIDNKMLNSIDLLAFCHPKICPHLESFCTKITKIKGIYSSKKQTCWAIEQSYETDIPYNPLNSFIMFKRKDIMELPKKYKYLLRTDYDVFFSPALFLLKPTKFLFGNGGYSDPFNMKRLKEVSQRLGMAHRGRHGIGSTWCADANQFITIANKTYDTTRYVYLNEFDPKSQGLETINFTKNREGEWIRWWRPVSLLYGGEIAINHMLPDISDANKGKFDASSCSEESVWKAYHIHCWHNPCHFSKFEFDSFMYQLIYGTKDLNNKLSKELVKNGYEKDTRNMTMRQFSSYIAYNAVGKYLQRYFQ